MPRDPAWEHTNGPTESGPPGHFLSDDLKSDTERFLADVKRLVMRRQVVEREGPGHPSQGPADFQSP